MDDSYVFDPAQPTVGRRLAEPASPLSKEDTAVVAEAARWAPSVHNTQPWRFRARPRGLEIHENLDRALPVVDPYGRDRLISCGAAAYNASLAIGHLGWAPQLAICPDRDRPGLVATVDRGPRLAPDRTRERLYEAIPVRRSHRRVFLPTPVDAARLDRLRAAAADHDTWLRVVGPRRRARLARLLFDGAVAQSANRAFREEISRWLRDTAGGSDGVPIASLGTAPYPVDGLITRDLAIRFEAREWVHQELGRSTVAVLFSHRDERTDWVRSGVALQHLLLVATVDGLVASFADQPIQQTRLRPQLAELLDEPGYPQAILRIGEPMVSVPPTPRRPLADLFMDV
jgi:nitroreductase